MIELGKVQKLEIKSNTKFGVHLNTKVKLISDRDILLPRNQVSKEAAVGDEIEVFVYKDSEDELIATTKKPFITLGEIKKLKVIDNNEFGAFLDWGLEKDLMLPFKEQKEKVEVGKEYLVSLYIDNTNRLCATTFIYELLSNESLYKAKDMVKGTIYSINPEFGAFVAIDNKYHGLIPNKELYGEYKISDEVEVKIIKIRDDGKLELSLRQEAYIEIDGDAGKIFEKLLANDGKLPFNDNSDPYKIKEEFAMSKSAFKRAIGRLYKEQKILITDNGIEIIK